MERLSWEEYALKLAETASLRSRDPYLKVGACALRHDHSVAACAYNGEPPGVEIDWTSRDERRKRVLHAEMNLLRYCKPNEIKLVACSLRPCSDCLKNLAAYGIKTVIYRDKYNKDDFSEQLAKEFGIELMQINEKS